DQAVDRPAAQRLVRARVHVREPLIELGLEVALIRESPPGLEVGFGVALQALDGALGLRITFLTERPTRPQLAAEGSERIGRPPPAGVQRARTVPDQRLRKPAQRPQTTADAPQNVGRLLGEDQRAGTRARVPKAGDHDIADPGLAEP